MLSTMCDGGYHAVYGWSTTDDPAQPFGDGGRADLPDEARADSVLGPDAALYVEPLILAPDRANGGAGGSDRVDGVGAPNGADLDRTSIPLEDGAELG